MSNWFSLDHYTPRRATKPRRGVAEHHAPQNPPDANTAVLCRLFGKLFSVRTEEQVKKPPCKGSAVFQTQPVSQKVLLAPGLHLHSTQTRVVGLADEKHQLAVQHFHKNDWIPLILVLQPSKPGTASICEQSWQRWGCTWCSLLK